MAEHSDFEKGYSTYASIDFSPNYDGTVPKIDKMRISDSGSWIVTYSTGENSVIAAWEIVKDTDTGQFNDVQLRWCSPSEQGSFATITISPDGNYTAGFFETERKEIIVYSKSANGPVVRTPINSYCIPTFLPSGQLALLTDHSLNLLEPPLFKESRSFHIPPTDEFWRRYDQPLHRGIIYRFEPNNYLSFSSIASDGGLIRYVQTGITEWNRAGIAVSQTGTLVAFYCGSHFTVVHAASGMVASSFEWPQIKDYPQSVFFDFVNEDRFLVGCFSDYGTNTRLWRWDMDNASLWISENIVHDSLAIFPHNKGIIIQSHSENEQDWKLKILQTVKGEVRPVKSGTPAYFINPSDDNDQNEADTPGEIDNDRHNPYMNEDDIEKELPRDQEFKKRRFDVRRIEPWVVDTNETLGTAYLLDENNKIQLLVGLTTIQLWMTQYTLPPKEAEFRKLLHIWHVPRPYLSIPASETDTSVSYTTMRIKQSRDWPDIKFFIHEKALSVRVTYNDCNSDISESELFHLPIPYPQLETQYRPSIPSNHREQLLIHAWHALVSYWSPMNSGRKLALHEECFRCKSHRESIHLTLRPSKPTCQMLENGCLECLESGKICPVENRFYVMDGIYDLVTRGISTHWDVFARISGAIFYSPILKGKNCNLYEYLQLTESEQQLPSSLFRTSEMVARPLLRSIETGTTGRVRDFLEYMIAKFTHGTRGRKELGYMYPITQSLLALDQNYPDFLITIMESSNYLEATRNDPLRKSDATIMPGPNFRSDRSDLYAFSISDRLKTSAIAPPETTDAHQVNLKRRGQGRPVTLCLVPFVDLNSVFEYVYDQSARMIIKKKLNRSTFAKLALHGGSGFFGTPVSEAILNSKWESGVKNYWAAFFTMHILYYALFCLTIPSYLSWDPKLYPLREILIIIYIIFGSLFYASEARQLLFGSWYGEDMNTPHATIKSIFRSAQDYFASFYNWVDTAAYFLPIAAGLYTLIEKEQWPNPASAFTILILWIHFLLQLRIFKELGKYITILIEIGKSIGWLLVIIATLIFAFAHAIFSLMYGYEPNDDDTTEAFISFDRTLRTTWFFLSGDWTPADNYHDNRSLAILTILFSFLTVIVFINVLIAVMGSIVENTQVKADRIWLQMYAQIVAEIEVYWTWKEHNRPDIVYYEASTELFHKLKREREKNNGKEDTKETFL